MDDSNSNLVHPLIEQPLELRQYSGTDMIELGHRVVRFMGSRLDDPEWNLFGCPVPLLELLRAHDRGDPMPDGCSADVRWARADMRRGPRAGSAEEEELFRLAARLVARVEAYKRRRWPIAEGPPPANLGAAIAEARTALLVRDVGKARVELSRRAVDLLLRAAQNSE